MDTKKTKVHGNMMTPNSAATLRNTACATKARYTTYHICISKNSFLDLLQKISKDVMIGHVAYYKS